MPESVANTLPAMGEEWRNWAGDQHCRPQRIEMPASREQLAEVVGRASEAGLRVRASASGHSFSDVALTDGVMVRLDRLDRVLDADPAAGLVRAQGGIVLGELNRRMDARGLAFENLGDIDRQTLAGSISTGTHGTGARFPSVSAQVVALELVLADGSFREIGAGEPELLDAARIGLGALGVIHAVTIRAVPAYTIQRVDSPKPLAETLARLDELVESNDHFEFYVFPHTETALCRESRHTQEPPRPPSRAALFAREVVLENWVGAVFAQTGRRMPSQAPRLARLASRVGGSVKIDRSFRVFASERRIRFTEMEYGLAREHAAEAVGRVLELGSRPELGVAYPIEVRFVGPDSPHLSASQARETCYIAVHQDRHLDWEPYFRGVEEIMEGYGGRPHWGKRHFQSAESLAPRYPGWAAWQAARAELDPSGVFSNAYTGRVLGPPSAAGAA